MKKNVKSVTEYEIDSVWSIIVEGGTVTKYHLLNKMAGTSKVIGTSPDQEEAVDTVVEQMIENIKSFQEDMIFDTDVNPKHMVNKMADIWKTCSQESEFIANITYLVLGIMVKAYNDINDSEGGFAFEDSDVSVAIMAGVHRVGETLMSVEHRSGSVNVAAKNRVESLY